MDILELKEDHSKNDKNITMTSYFSDFIKSIYYRIVGNNSDVLFKDWEWLLNKEEVSENSKLTQNKQELVSELNSLTKLNFMNTDFKNYILNYICNNTIELTNSKLHSSNRSHLLKELITKNYKTWLDIIKLYVHKYSIHESISKKNIINSWTYIEKLDNLQENMCNQLINISFSSSNLAENQDLNPVILCDIYWSIYLFLTKEISLVLPFQFNKIEYQHLITCMLDQSLNNFILSWTKMCHNTGDVQLKLSRFSKIWNENNQNEKLRLEQLKKDGLVDAKFNSDNDIVIKIKDFDDKVLTLDKLLTPKHKSKVVNKCNSDSDSQDLMFKKELLSKLLTFKVK